MATYAWISGGELPSQRLRSYTFGLATAVGFFAAWLATFTAPYFINPEALNWGPKYGYIWTPSCWLAAYVFPFSIRRLLDGWITDIRIGLGCSSSCQKSRIGPWRKSMRW